MGNPAHTIDAMAVASTGIKNEYRLGAEEMSVLKVAGADTHLNEIARKLKEFEKQFEKSSNDGGVAPFAAHIFK